MTELPEAEDQLLNYFWTVYQPALNALASDPQTACEATGNHNTAWEIQNDLTGVEALANSAALALDEEQQDGMLALAAGLAQLPPEAIAPPGAVLTSHEGCVRAMRHPAWQPLRRAAAELAELLEPAFDRTEDYFYPD